MTVREVRSSTPYIVHVEGSLRWPVGRDLRERVRTQLRRGDRHILIDLGRVSQIDAAGVGELVRAYNMATAMAGSLRIVGAARSVREVLERAGLFGLLSAESEP